MHDYRNFSNFQGVGDNVLKLGAIVLLLGLTILSVAGIPLWYFPSTSLNYKLAIDIDDNGVPRHGEGVIGITFHSNGFMRTSQTPLWSIGVRGEAFVVDLGERGALFVLLSGDRSRKESAEAGRQAMWRYFGDSFGNLPPNYSGKLKILKFGRSRPTVDVAPNSLPLLVRFRNINDPKTVERVDPEHIDLAFGAGVRLIHAAVTLTSEPVTTGIDKRLVWLNDLGNKTLGGTYLKPIESFPEQLGILDFRRELR